MRYYLSWYWVFHCSLTPLFVLSGASAKSRCLGKLSHPSLLSRQVKTVIFISKITIPTKSPILLFVPMRTHNTPCCPKKEQNYCHLACRNYSYPSRWLLVTTNCRLGPPCTWYCHRSSSNCTGLLFCSLWFCVQKCVRIVVKCLNRTPDSLGMFTDGVWAQMTPRQVSLLANDTLYANFGSRNIYLKFLGALFWGIFGT